MRFALKSHPDTRCEAVTGIEVEVAREGRALRLRYIATGDIAGLRLPLAAAPVRSDGLWRHTCFEAFLRGSSGEAYAELNFSPSTQWAAYRFSSYRTGMEALDIEPPRIEARSDPGRYELLAYVALPHELSHELPLRLGISAMVEEANGSKSYWALVHPAAKPDFHHPDSFACEIP